MNYLVDSDWIVDYLNGLGDAVAFLDTLRTEGFAISAITFGEILEGILNGREPEVDEARFKDFLRVVSILPVTTRTMRIFAEIRGQLRRQGQMIADMDLLIASTALAHDLTLVTRNRRHFERVPGLQLYGVS